MKTRALGCALALALGLGATGTATAEDWPGYNGGGGQNRAAASRSGHELGVLWRSPVVSANAPACTAVVGERVFVVANSPEDPGSFALSALSRATGAVLWTTPSFGTYAHATCPAAGGEHVYVTAYDGVGAYDAASGAHRWTADADAYSAPVLAGDSVYLTGWPTERLALDAATGEERWSVTGFVSGAPPVIAGPVALFEDGNDLETGVPGVNALSRADGSTEWSVPHGENAIAAGGRIFMMEGSLWEQALVARDPATGAAAWTRPSPWGRRATSLVADESQVHVRAAFQDGNLLGRVSGYDAVDGDQLFSRPSANLNDLTLFRTGTGVLSIGYSGGSAYDPASGDAVPLEIGFADLNATSAYADSTFYTWRQVPGGGGWELVALRDVRAPALAASQPADGAVSDVSNPRFAWSADDGRGVGLERTELAIDGRNPVQLAAAGGEGTPVALLDGTYRWRVRSRDAVGNEASTPERVLHVDTAAPEEFALRAPADGTTVAEARPTLSWDAAADATTGVQEYRVRLDDALVATVGPDACSAGACAVTLPQPVADGAHRWSVTAVDRAGNARAGGPRTLTVAAPPAGSLTASAAVVLTGEELRLDAAFADPNGRIVTHAWDLDGDGAYERTTGAQAGVTTRLPTTGAHTVRVRVTDEGGLTAEGSAPVEARPAPPAGELGVSIAGGAIATNDRDVQLTVVWPRLALDALVSNDGGFGAAGGTRAIPLAQTIPWTLSSSGSERLPKTVYLRFRGGESGRETYSDDIILDERAPQLEAVSAPQPAAAPPAGGQQRGGARAPGTRAPGGRARRGRTVRRAVRVRARDANSGVAIVQISARRTARGAVAVRVVGRNKRGKRRYQATVRVRTPAGRLWVRVLDAAGNPSAWRRTR